MSHLSVSPFLFFSGLVFVVGAALWLPLRWLRLFRSIWFNVALFLIIAGLAALGTALPHEMAPNQVAERLIPFFSALLGPLATPFSVGAARGMDRLGLFDVYHTRWFEALLLLMAFDVVACKLRTFPRRFTHRKDHTGEHWHETPDAALARCDLRAEWTAPVVASTAEASVRRWLNAEGFRASAMASPASSGGGATLTFAADRHRLQRWGDFLLHVSLVLILGAGLLGALFGFQEFVTVGESGTVALRNRPWSIRLNRFQMERYSSTGAPRTFRSDLDVYEGQRLLREASIRVNHPLELRGVRFYQSSWGMTEQLRSAWLSVGSVVARVPFNETAAVGTEGLSIRVDQFYPSFELGPDHHARNVDAQGVNPAVRVEFSERGKVTGRFWLLRDELSRAYRVLADERLESVPAPPIRLREVDPVLSSGIQVGYDPGAPWFWFAATTLLIGLFLHFYLHGRGVIVSLAPAPAGTLVRFGSWSSRSSADIWPEFQRWSEHLRLQLPRGEATSP